MVKTENQCEQLRTSMLSIVFDLVYSTFWSSRSERERQAEHFRRVQVVIRRLAGALFHAPASDGSTPREVGECVESIAAEVERLGQRRDIAPERLAEARARVERMRELVRQMADHCARMHAEQA